MNCLAGVDEAGLGPILGPLVVAGVAMRGPEGLDPWAALRGHVSRRKHVDNKVRVADSKKVHQGPHGKERLESTALSFWTAFAGEVPTDVRGSWPDSASTSRRWRAAPGTASSRCRCRASPTAASSN